MASKRPRPARPPFHCDHLKRAGPLRVGDLDAIKVVFEAGVATAADNRAVARDRHDRRERGAELALGRWIILELAENRAAVLVCGQAQQPETEVHEGALGRVRAAERGLDQPVGVLEAVQCFLRHFENHRVAHAVVDARRRGHRARERRAEIGREPLDRGGRVRHGAGKPRENAVGPGATRSHRHVHVAADHEGGLDLEPVRLGRRHRGDAGADDVAAGLALPAELDQLTLGEVGVTHHAALLVQHAVDVAQHPVGRWRHPAVILVRIEVENREIALHG